MSKTNLDIPRGIFTFIVFKGDTELPVSSASYLPKLWNPACMAQHLMLSRGMVVPQQRANTRYGHVSTPSKPKYLHLCKLKSPSKP